MTAAQLVFHSVRFYWRTHLGVLLGAILASGILVGALLVGDSVRYSLERLALVRLGDTQLALISPEQFFRSDLADRLETSLQGIVAPVVQMRGTLSTPDESGRVNLVQVLGVEGRFWKVGKSRNLLSEAGDDDVVLNTRLAGKLNAKAGDTVIIRIEQPSYISRDAPLSGKSDSSVALRVRVKAIAGDEDFGRYSLQANQVPSYSVFVPLHVLQKHLKREDRANLLLVAGVSERPVAEEALRKQWKLEDAALELNKLEQPGQFELRTQRIFVDAVVAHAAGSMTPQAAGVLTYLVNEIRHGDKATPYSMVTAVAPTGAGFLPADLAANEIVITSWLADDLGAKVGDEVSLRYFVVGDRRELKEESSVFRIRAVLPMESPGMDSSWMPQYPGVADVENCRDWEPGVPVDTKRIRPKDEAYWHQYRGTPKAFLNLEAAQQIWSNRFGNLTAIRFPATVHTKEALTSALREKLDPASLGLFFQPVREQGLKASRQSLDFGQLFIGFSFFLIVAALLLMAMLFVFNLEQRTEEVGTLLALGFRPAHVRRFFFAEGFAIALVGTLLGTLVGSIYTKLTLHGLSTVWRNAVGTSDIRYHAEPSTLTIGALASLAMAMLAIWIMGRRQACRPAAELLASGAEIEVATVILKHRSLGLWIGALSLLGALVMLASARNKIGLEAAETFFGAGSLLLIAGIGFCQRLLVRMIQTASRVRSIAALGLRNAARRRGRSLTTISVLASGIFLLVAVNAFRHDPLQGASDPRSGTGGFALYGESVLPIYGDLNSDKGREEAGVSALAVEDVSFVSMRVRDGDDASCLNLNRALQPRLLGVRPEELRERFTFVRTGNGASQNNPWLLLDEPQEKGVVAAIGDQQTVTWALGKSLGSTLPYTDEHGQTFTLKIVGVLANSILQGGLLISERNLIARFPSSAGYRAFLVDAPESKVEECSKTLSRAWKDRGAEWTPAWGRLADFQAVENTYLGIFQVLGGLGLLLGSLGLGVVVLRNILERRSELALLEAVGFRGPELQKLVLSEHWLLILLGGAMGILAAALAVWPTLQAPGAEVPYRFLVTTLASILLGAFLWVWLATRVALRRSLLEALRNE